MLPLKSLKSQLEKRDTHQRTRGGEPGPSWDTHLNPSSRLDVQKTMTGNKENPYCRTEIEQGEVHTARVRGSPREKKTRLRKR